MNGDPSSPQSITLASFVLFSGGQRGVGVPRGRRRDGYTRAAHQDIGSAIPGTEHTFRQQRGRYSQDGDPLHLDCGGKDPSEGNVPCPHEDTRFQEIGSRKTPELCR